MNSKILFKNETTYTPDIALEAGEVFWKVQPAYRKRAKKFRILSGILAVSFTLMAILAIKEQGLDIASIGALVMAVVAVFGFLRSENLIKGSAKNFQGMDTRVTYGVSENFFFVLNREYVRRPKNGEQDALEAPDEEDEDADETLYEESDETEDEDGEKNDENADNSIAISEEGGEEDDSEETNEYADELLPLEKLLVCIVSENLYILIWEKPYYILDRRCFKKGDDSEFRKFIEERVDVIEA